jgi:peptide/nickel transport system ATP-binding protein
MVFISHNIAVIGHITDDIVVMRGGRIVEQGPTRAVLLAPKHPYTRQLLTAAGVHASRQQQVVSGGAY